MSTSVLASKSGNKIRSAKIDARVDPTLKQRAATILEEEGLSFSEAINLLLVYVTQTRRLPDPTDYWQTEIFNIDAPTDARKIIERAAQLQGRTIPAFVADAAKEIARQVVEREAVISLSLRDQERFAQAMLAPAKLSPSLQRAAKRRQQRGLQGNKK